MSAPSVQPNPKTVDNDPYYETWSHRARQYCAICMCWPLMCLIVRAENNRSRELRLQYEREERQRKEQQRLQGPTGYMACYYCNRNGLSFTCTHVLHILPPWIIRSDSETEPDSQFQLHRV